MRILVPLALLLTACGSPPAKDCVVEHPAGSDSKIDSPYLDEALHECAADGHACDPHGWISSSAAECIASAKGMKDGLVGLQAMPFYDHHLGVAVWYVTNVSAKVLKSGTWGPFHPD